jgi:hypothetical protein
MLSETKIREIAGQITDANEIAKITAHFLLAQTKDCMKEMVADTGNDAETRATAALALIDTNDLLETCQDGNYAMAVDDFFEDVSRHLVAYARDYVTK